MGSLFPGPLDGFSPPGIPQKSPAERKRAKTLLKKRVSFKQAPGLTVIAYGGGIDASLTKEVLRLLEGSAEQLSKLTTAHPILRCCAYIAATNKDIGLSNAVTTRCLRLIAAETPENEILALLLVAIRACAAHGNSTTYYLECGNVASRFAHAASASSALDIRAALEEIGHREPKFIAAFGQAMAVLDAASTDN
jgi:hypothetical protein